MNTYSIKEVAQMLGIKENALRFYEKKGLLHPKRQSNGYRQYDFLELSKAQMIVLYRKFHFPIEAIEKLLQENNQSLDLFIKQYEQVTRTIHEMKQIQNSLIQSINTLLLNEDTDTIIKRMKNEAHLFQTSEWVDHWKFDTWADTYDESILKPTKGLPFYEHYDEVLQLCIKELPKEGNVVDVGIGTGNLSKQILETYPNIELVGVEPSLSMCRQCKKKLPQIPLYIGHFLQIPLEDHCMDAIVSTYAFHHCKTDEKLQAMKEIKRVLKPNGICILGDLMFENKKARREYETQCTPRQLRELEDEFFANIDILQSQFLSEGFTFEAKQVDEIMWVIVAKQQKMD